MSELALHHLNIWKHAVATPLTTLQLAVDQANEELPSANMRQRALLTQIKSQLTYLCQLVFPSEDTRFSLRSVLAQTTTRLDCFPQRRLALIDQLTTDIELPGSGLELQEALSCAITNSWEAYESNQHQVVLVTCYLKGSNILIQITDYGKGMNWLTRTAFVSKQRSTKPNHHGLGTTFIKQIIQELYHGRVLYSSYIGIGTTQTWLIPIKWSN